MDITDLISDDYIALPPDTPVSKLVGTFEDKTVTGVLVQGDVFEGVVTRRQLLTSHHPPNQKLGSLAWNVPRLSPDEEIRKTAQLMIDSSVRLLPVFEDGDLTGVVKADAILQKVQPYLDAATVRDAFTADLETLTADSTLGQALHVFRSQRITHLPVVEQNDVTGILSVYDVADLTVREEVRSQGGEGGGTDPFGGTIANASGRSRRGGFGAREGESDRMLDLPVRDAMTAPVHTITPEETLAQAVDRMFEVDASSLVVTDNGKPFGIVTKTDVLDSLTWEAEGRRAVQVYGTELLEDLTHEDIVAMIEKFDDRDHGMNILDAKVHLHEHDETLRGKNLLLARVRLHTDRGLYLASGEGYGASHAVNEARDALERQIRDKKTQGRSKKPRDEEFWEKRFGWVLERLD